MQSIRKDLKVLIVEDEELIREAIKSYILNFVDEPMLASNGEDGLKIFEEYKPDLIISDINMPKMDGLEMSKVIKDKSPTTKIILLSGENDSSFFIKAIEIGVSYFVTKPLSITFSKTINKVMQIILKEKELDERTKLLEQYKRMVDASNLVSKTDKNGIITYANEEFCKISGYTKEELIGKPHNIVRHPKMPKSAFKNMWETILAKKSWKGLVRNRKKDGSSYYVKTVIVPILNENSEINEFIAMRHDVTQIVKQKLRIKNIHTDDLTGFPNGEKLIEDIKSFGEQIHLTLLNIDDFKEINGYYGNKIGDKTLIEVSFKLKELIKGKKVKLYKLKADEFALLSYQNLAKDEFLNISKEVVEEIDNSIFTIEENTFDIRMTGGMASFCKEGDLIQNANLALSYAKEIKHSFVEFEEAKNLQEKYKNNLKWTKELKLAINEDRIITFAQPIINLENNKIEKYECLVRMIGSDGKIISPFFFLDVAKKAKLYPFITQTVIKQSFEYFSKKEYEFSINLSVEDILEPSTVDFLKEQIAKFDVKDKLVLEIVESEGIENFKDVSKFIEDMKNLGCQIAVDDFGTGYSNFKYLIELNVDILKIDGSLIKDIAENRNSQIATESIINFAQKLNIKTVAEFVHSEEVLNKIKELNIDYGQGFHLGEPAKLE